MTSWSDLSPAQQRALDVVCRWSLEARGVPRSHAVMMHRSDVDVGTVAWSSGKWLVRHQFARGVGRTITPTSEGLRVWKERT